MSTPTACIAPTRKAPHSAAPGRYLCHPCADQLATTLADITTVYATLDTVEELIPGGHGDTGGRKPAGPRSPAVDDILVHTDPRSSGNDHLAALATVESWARLVREELGAQAPSGRITMDRETATLRFHWDWLMSQPWVNEFGAEMAELLRALRTVGRLTVPTMRVGTCPRVVPHLLDDGSIVGATCGASLTVRVDAEGIRCRACGSSWARSQWRAALGDPWTDYARLSDELGVPVGTLWYWAARDGWTMSGTRQRRLVLRVDALESYQRRRGDLPLDQAG